jgi:hypothetical protein
MDIAAFKVSHSVGKDKDATTTLRATRARSSSKGAMEERSQKVQNASSHRNAIILRTHKAHSQFSGALEERSRQEQKASTHCSQC